MRYELVIVWETGEKEITQFATKDEAESAGRGMKMAFGEQVWYCVRERR